MGNGILDGKMNVVELSGDKRGRKVIRKQREDAGRLTGFEINVIAWKGQ